MFDLDGAVNTWRARLSDSGIKDSAVIDELESHLRDEMQQQVQSGVAAHAAFEAAARRIGQPAILKSEFAKVAVGAALQDRIKNFILTLAGIPNPNLVTSMNTSSSNIEPGWATYLKAGTFLLPALLLTPLCAIFVVPKLQQICNDAGLPVATQGAFWNLIHSSIQMMIFFTHHGLLLTVLTIGLLVGLEWRSRKWPRYRRAAIGTGAFLLNTIVLLAMFMMFLAAMVAAPALAHHAK
jgi:hypothetical protein